MNQFGDQIRQLREQNGLLQRHVANQLDMDTPMLSKIERGERSAKREHVEVLSKVFNVPDDDLETIWLADKIYDLVKDESTGLKSIEVVHALLRKEVKAQPLVKAK